MHWNIPRLRFRFGDPSEIKSTIWSRQITVSYNTALYICLATVTNIVHNQNGGSLQWRHNERDGVSNHQPHDCLFNRLFRHTWKKTSKLRVTVRVTGLCEGNSPLTGEFPSQRSSNAENVSIWWRHHVYSYPTVSLHLHSHLFFSVALNPSRVTWVNHPKNPTKSVKPPIAGLIYTGAGLGSDCLYNQKNNRKKTAFHGSELSLGIT